LAQLQEFEALYLEYSKWNGLQVIARQVYPSDHDEVKLLRADGSSRRPLQQLLLACAVALFALVLLDIVRGRKVMLLFFELFKREAFGGLDALLEVPARLQEPGLINKVQLWLQIVPV